MRSGVSPTPYQQQAVLDFDEPFWELFAEKIRKNNSSTPHQEQADLDFYESFTKAEIYSIFCEKRIFYWLILKGILNILLDVRCFSLIFFFFEHSTLLAIPMQLMFFIKFQCFFVTAVRAISRYKF